MNKILKVEKGNMHGNNYETPQWFYNILNNKYNFQVDLACDSNNCKSPLGITKDINSLEIKWSTLTDGYLWLNPPYSPVKPWIIKAQDEFKLGAKIVLLVPPTMLATKYFKRVLPTKLFFICGRLSFSLDGKTLKGNSKDSCVLVYDGLEKKGVETKWINRDDLATGL